MFSKHEANNSLSSFETKFSQQKFANMFIGFLRTEYLGKTKYMKCSTVGQLCTQLT